MNQIDNIIDAKVKQQLRTDMKIKVQQKVELKVAELKHKFMEEVERQLRVVEAEYLESIGKPKSVK